MRLVAIGGAVTLLSVFGLRSAFDSGPHREFCEVVSVSPDDRFQFELWQDKSLDPTTRALDVFDFGNCSHDGYFVLRERATREQVAEVASHNLWALQHRGYREDGDGIRWEARAAVADDVPNGARLELPPGIAPIENPPGGWKCSDIDDSPDGMYRLEAWSHHKPPADAQGSASACGDNGGEIRLVERATNRVIKALASDRLSSSLERPYWLAHHVELHVFHDGEPTLERLALDLD